MASYAPPAGPPPPELPTGGRSNGYAPTSTPVPGQPLLRNGKMLVYPHNWRGCQKCHDTGYKNNDPYHPCRKCWQDYGQTFNPLLITSSSLQGAKVLQRPLPDILPTAGSMPGQFPPVGRMERYPMQGNQGYPGMVSTQNTGSNPFDSPISPNSTGSGSQIHPHPTGNANYYTAPSHPPPPQQQQQQQQQSTQQRDDRPQASREDDLNEDGEAPPAYDLAVAAGPDGALPPQRAEEQQSNSHSTTQHSQQQYAPPSHQPHSPPLHGQFSPPPLGHPSNPIVWNSRPSVAIGMRPTTVFPGHRPPPNALVVHPGDHRIGGQLCYKCGGQGSRESFWFGDVTVCNVCNGIGRIFV